MTVDDKVTEALEPPKWVSATPMIRTERGTWSKVHYNKDGEIEREVLPEEADAIGAWQFHILDPASPEAAQALAIPEIRDALEAQALAARAVLQEKPE